jgi:hypothetical protein
MLSLAVVLLSFGAPAVADVLLEYEMENQPGNQVSNAPTAEAFGIDGIDLARGPGLTPVAGLHSLNSSAWTGPQPNDFLIFGFDVDDGLVALVDSFFFATRSSATGPGFVDIFYSIDGGPETFVTQLIQPVTTFVNTDFDFGSSLLVEESFRLILRSANNTAANGGAIAGAGTLRIGDYSPDGGQTFQPITIEGQLRSIPEPASVVLAGVGFLGLVVFARVKRRV